MCKNQKELKEIYMDVIKMEVWKDYGMQEYARRKSSYIVELSNGNILSLEKPEIQKDFCFGAGMYGRSTDDDFSDAEKKAQTARTEERYFIEENTRLLKIRIEELKKALDGKLEVYTFVAYYGQPDNSILVDYNITNFVRNPKNNPESWKNYKSLKKLNDDDIEKIILGLEDVLKKFEKRLFAYLKKYGLEKINVWTYLRD